MMSFSILLRSPPSEEQFRLFVQHRLLGGRWNEFPVGLERGVVIDGDAHVFVEYHHDLAREDFLTEMEIEFARNHLGTAPGVAIGINVGHAAGAVELARRVAEAIVQTFDGWVWDYEGVLGPAMGPSE